MTKQKIIYLAAYKAHHPNHDMDYNDIMKTSEHINVIGDMLQVDLEPYDIIIASPPCNYWSRAMSTEERRQKSKYAMETRHLLIDILKKMSKQDKPFIVENVRNAPLFVQYGLYDLPLYVYEYGRHTYWTNIPFNPQGCKTYNNGFHNEKGGYMRYKGINLQGGQEVHDVIERWLEVTHGTQNNNRTGTGGTL